MLADDVDAWLRLLALHNQEGLADAEPDTMRFRIYNTPARLAVHARRRHLRLAPDLPWAAAFVLAWQRLTSLTAVTCRPGRARTKTRKESLAAPRDCGTRRSRSDTRSP
ncbi:hypothetical protein ACWGBO_29600 [[Kitasatospora] papulosa]